ncbi:DNA-processing protein DprA [Paenibacillus mucilaginosus]|uniref:DNA protecting protein DprA n=1 Tax=Paenibacillus mucilaginosus (strain KNP414) TaxID=1036673 RepID=F8F9M4_PAEMK|nr:DNA-processing protein DprA [Paenibacillus mucilaginosus]AEI44353.1 DNA protecting protein DprA [Paenibacillus mucilaginosus KNP414]MCG7217593.1 DNA-processing protein DprA [Paenibacillus mucilaginosus]WDM25749.1 DNA-processing protein DprA [Paenibacillus mucilaginosus]
MNNRDILIALHHMPGVGSRTIDLVFQHVSDFTEIRTRDLPHLTIPGLTPARASALSKGWAGLSAASLEMREEAYRERGIGCITRWDEEYPEMLRELPDAPWVLYTRGDVSLLKRHCIAMVGTRTPTAYGRAAAEGLSEGLSGAGLCVVSGMARGIDACAHIGALKEQGGTIAVLGCAIDEVYPPENKALYHRIADHALLLSEYPVGTKSHPGLFPQRNRIIAGLSLGVVVVEAALRSGSLITADQALEASRDVFAVPGPISSPKSQGTLSLLKQGAKLVSSAQDIVEEYTDRISFPSSAYIIGTGKALPELTPDEKRICDLLLDHPMNVDELLAGSGFTFGHLHSVLINLLMMRRIAELPGAVYTVP